MTFLLFTTGEIVAIIGLILFILFMFFVNGIELPDDEEVEINEQLNYLQTILNSNKMFTIEMGSPDAEKFIALLIKSIKITDPVPVVDNTLPFIFSINFQTIKAKNIMLTLEVGQHALGTLAPKKANGEPATVETGKTVFSSSNEEVATVTQDPDNELSCKVVCVGIGEATITGSVDADLGEGIRTLTATATVTGVEATARTLEFGTGEAQD